MSEERIQEGSVNAKAVKMLHDHAKEVLKNFKKDINGVIETYKNSRSSLYNRRANKAKAGGTKHARLIDVEELIDRHDNYLTTQSLTDAMLEYVNDKKHFSWAKLSPLRLNVKKVVKKFQAAHPDMSIYDESLSVYTEGDSILSVDDTQEGATTDLTSDDNEYKAALEENAMLRMQLKEKDNIIAEHKAALKENEKLRMQLNEKDSIIAEQKALIDLGYPDSKEEAYFKKVLSEKDSVHADDPDQLIIRNRELQNKVLQQAETIEGQRKLINTLHSALDSIQKEFSQFKEKVIFVIDQYKKALSFIKNFFHKISNKRNVMEGDNKSAVKQKTAKSPKKQSKSLKGTNANVFKRAKHKVLKRGQEKAEQIKETLQQKKSERQPRKSELRDKNSRIHQLYYNNTDPKTGINLNNLSKELGDTFDKTSDKLSYIVNSIQEAKNDNRDFIQSENNKLLEEYVERIASLEEMNQDLRAGSNKSPHVQASNIKVPVSNSNNRDNTPPPPPPPMINVVVKNDAKPFDSAQLSKAKLGLVNKIGATDEKQTQEGGNGVSSNALLDAINKLKKVDANPEDLKERKKSALEEALEARRFAINGTDSDEEDSVEFNDDDWATDSEDDISSNGLN